MTDRIQINHSSPSTQFFLEADVIGLYRVRLYLRCVNTGTTGSVDNGNGWQNAEIDGIGQVGIHGPVAPFLPAGAASGATRWRDGPWDVYVGPATYGITLRQKLYYGDNATATLAVQPQPPTPAPLDQITPVSMRFQFSANGAGGAPIDGWEAQIAEDAAFTVGVQTIASGGNTTFSGLTPGKTYYARARGHNTVGWGDYSSTVSATTLSGGRYWNGASWQDVIAREWDGATWRNVFVRSWDGASWRTDR